VVARIEVLVGNAISLPYLALRSSKLPSAKRVRRVAAVVASWMPPPSTLRARLAVVSAAIRR